MPDMLCPPETRPNPHALRQVGILQRDGLLLIAHLAEATDRALADATPGGVSHAEMSLLTDPAEAVAGDPDRLDHLLRLVERLGRAAAPATTTSIRVTCGFLLGLGPDATQEERGMVRALRWRLQAIRALLVAATALSVGLLMHVDDGRRTVGQLATVRAELATVFSEMAKLDPATDWILAGPGLDAAAAPPAPETPARSGPAATPARPFIAYCEPDPALAEKTAPAATPLPAARDPHRLPAKATAQALCSQLAQLRLREAMTFTRLAAWNCRMVLLQPRNWRHWLSGAPATDAAAQCLQPPVALRAPVTPADWERTELRTSAGITMLTGYLLPLLLGFIGGCVYVLRRTDDRIASWTLSARDGRLGIIRVTLAATLGGLLGLLFGTEAPVQLGGFSLSLAAWAFFLGYSLEPVLKLLDAVIDGVVGKLRPPAGTKPAPAAPPR
jgi:hypothetical protein